MDTSTNNTEQQSPATAGPRWSILMTDAALRRYCFVRTIAAGMQGTAQLCQRIDDGQLVVRKRAINVVVAGRAARADRECVIAAEVSTRQAAAGADAAAHRFANLIDNSNLPVPDTEENQGQFFRESWWSYYSGGGSLDDFMRFILRYNQSVGMHELKQELRPNALVLRLIRQSLEALQWLNSVDIMHLDAHAKNIFLDWDQNGELVPVVGDFGYSRLAPPHEAPFNDRGWLWQQTSEERANFSSPPPDPTIDDASQRLPLDLLRLLENVQNSLWMAFPTLLTEDHAIMHNVIAELVQAAEAERENDKLPEDERPPRMDVTDLINRLQAVEQRYLDTMDGEAANEAAMTAWRANLAGGRTAPVEYATREEALAGAQAEIGGNGPYEVVNLSDPTSVQDGMDRLARVRLVQVGDSRGTSVDGGTKAAPGSPGPADEGEDLFTPWFMIMWMPAARSQYVEKYQRRGAGEPWEGIVFHNTDIFRDGPSAEQRLAFDTWAVDVLLPVARRLLPEM